MLPFQTVNTLLSQTRCNKHCEHHANLAYEYLLQSTVPSLSLTMISLIESPPFVKVHTMKLKLKLHVIRLVWSQYPCNGRYHSEHADAMLSAVNMTAPSQHHEDVTAI
jgi:hypothetical protein